MITARAPARAELPNLRGLLSGLLGKSAFQSYRIKHFDGSTEQVEITHAVKRTLATLSPATRRMLDDLRLALTVQADPARGYEFKGFASRADIARTLGKARLVPYDVEKLSKLVAAHLVSEDYHALPVMKVHGADGQELQYGAGGEFIYQIPPKIMHALITIDNPGVFAEMKKAREQAERVMHERIMADEQRDVTNSASVADYARRLNSAELVAEPRRRAAPAGRRWLGMTTRQVLALGVLALLLLGVLALAVWLLLIQ